MIYLQYTIVSLFQIKTNTAVYGGHQKISVTYLFIYAAIFFCLNFLVMKLIVLPEVFHVLQLPTQTPVPAWVLSSLPSCPFLSITKTEDELSIVCPSSVIPGLWLIFSSLI